MTRGAISTTALILFVLCLPMQGQGADACAEKLRTILPPAMDRQRFMTAAEPLFRELAAQAGRPNEVSFGETWSDTYKTFTSGSADLTLLSNREAGGALQMPGIHAIARTPGFWMILFTRADAGFNSIEDARHGQIAVPKGSDAEAQAARFFAERAGPDADPPDWLYLASVDEVLLSVLDGTAGAGVVPDFTLNWFASTLRERLRSLGPVGSSPGGLILMAGPCVSESERKGMRAFLLNPISQPEVTRFFATVMPRRFWVIDPDDLKRIREAGRPQERRTNAPVSATPPW
jgi:ABC-type phosphate/phosphonate transport system substrate-binding protein